MNHSIAGAKDLGNTFFQTNVGFDGRIALDVDFLVVHRHGDPTMANEMKTWMEAGFPTGRMFFIGSDADRLYTTGKWDGKEHLDETEVNREGQPIECGGTRPYMIPTEGWKAFVREQIKIGIDGGAACILPEEPLAHVVGGYGEAFKRIWAERYGKPWEPPHSSPDNFYKSSKLLCDLYYELVEDALAYTRQYAAEQEREVKFLLPIHPLLSHAVGHMTYASGKSLGLASKGMDGYVGQVWTGPIAWGMSSAEGKRMDRNADFFESAYLMYSYFANLVKGTSVSCYMLADPVEDDPQYSWEDYREWYNQCLVAMLQFPWMNEFEVAPWPDRIFLPGYQMATGTPGPEDYRRALMIAFAVLQELGDMQPTQFFQRFGYLVADTLGWQRGGPEGSKMESVHGFTVPLLRRGTRIDLVPIERHSDQAYLNGFKTLVLSYDAQKPLEPAIHTDLAEWVKRGGQLIYLGGEDAYNCVEEWWTHAGFKAPQEHLWETMGIWKRGENPLESMKLYSVGRGGVVLSGKSAASLADAPNALKEIQELVEIVNTEKVPWLDGSGAYTMNRGSFVAVRAGIDNILIPKECLDLLDPNIPVVKGPTVPAKTVALFKEITGYRDKKTDSRILFSGPRAQTVNETSNGTYLMLRSPDGTPTTLRLACRGMKVDKLNAFTLEGKETLTVTQEYDAPSDTLLCIVPTGFKGAEMMIHWK
jgi:hypothetical protein